MLTHCVENISICSQYKNYICINSWRLVCFHVYNLPQFGPATPQVLKVAVLGWMVAPVWDIVDLGFQLPGRGLTVVRRAVLI